MGAAAGAVLGMAGGVLGQLFANTNDARQIKQQGLLNRQQLQMNWEDRQQALDFDKYGAEQLPSSTVLGMQKAGLNPALAYGMTGAGGTTVNGGAGAAPEAPKGTGREQQEGAALGIQTAAQLGLMDAQRKNIEADTANKVAENPNISKTGEKITAETGKIGEEKRSIAQGVTNQKAAKMLIDAQARLENIKGNVAEQSQDDAIKQIHAESEKAISEVRQAWVITDVAEATKQAQIDIIKRTAVQKLLENALLRAQKTNTEQQTAASKEQVAQLVKSTAAQIAQGWDKNRITEQQNAIQNRLQEMGIDINDRNGVMNAISELLDLGIWGVNSTSTPTRQQVGGFHKR